MTYPLTIYTNSIKYAGEARGPVILIKPQYKEDKGLHAHEMVHVRQWLVATVVAAMVGYIAYAAWLSAHFGLDGLALIGLAPAAHGVLYTFVTVYRLHCEVEAYRVQADCYPDDRRPMFARYIAEDYGLKISQSKALELLRE